ncbi:hypothetical protein F5Y17DRAFT_439224 [Xylariaceae sp. FL0594]|nr:hypothetical protein F5Y17DRAFT_439224 [Xylariaceae sp. FL0594]
MNGYAEWTEGQCLGSDPKNPNGITKHLGWIPTRLRNPKAGLGADPQDEIWKDIFQGNLHVKPTKTFVRPKDTWKEDPSRVMTMVSSKDASNTMDVVSLPALLNMLPPPEPDTIDNRNASLASRQAKPIIVKDETKVVADTKKIERKVHVEVLTLSDSSVTDQGVETGESEEIDAVTTGVNSLDLLKDKDNGKDVKEEYKGKNDRREEDTKANGRSHVPAGYVSFRARFLGIAVAKS